MVNEGPWNVNAKTQRRFIVGKRDFAGKDGTFEDFRVKRTEEIDTT